jgi:hypothetical protein
MRGKNEQSELHMTVNMLALLWMAFLGGYAGSFPAGVSVNSWQIEPGTRGNTITLEVTNRLGHRLDHLSVYIDRIRVTGGGNIDVRIYDVLGQVVITLVSGNEQAGYHQVVWDGRNRAGTLVESGMYFYRIEATGGSGKSFSLLKKLVFMN